MLQKKEKLPDHIIKQGRNAILRGEFKAGDLLGSEKELMEEFGLSKGIFGGIFIAEVDMQTPRNSLTNSMHFKSVSIKDITRVRYLIEPPLAFFWHQSLPGKILNSMKI